MFAVDDDKGAVLHSQGHGNGSQGSQGSDKQHWNDWEKTPSMLFNNVDVQQLCPESTNDIDLSAILDDDFYVSLFLDDDIPDAPIGPSSLLVPFVFPDHNMSTGAESESEETIAPIAPIAPSSLLVPFVFPDHNMSTGAESESEETSVPFVFPDHNMSTGAESESESEETSVPFFTFTQDVPEFAPGQYSFVAQMQDAMMATPVIGAPVPSSEDNDGAKHKRKRAVESDKGQKKKQKPRAERAAKTGSSTFPTDAIEVEKRLYVGNAKPKSINYTLRVCFLLHGMSWMSIQGFREVCTEQGYSPKHAIFRNYSILTKSRYGRCSENIHSDTWGHNFPYFEMRTTNSGKVQIRLSREFELHADPIRPVVVKRAAPASPLTFAMV
jgi:hypothetical protein